jgi:hypothetical protein
MRSIIAGRIMKLGQIGTAVLLLANPWLSAIQ